jgi:hypothetical protein
LGLEPSPDNEKPSPLVECPNFEENKLSDTVWAISGPGGREKRKSSLSEVKPIIQAGNFLLTCYRVARVSSLIQRT